MYAWLNVRKKVPILQLNSETTNEVQVKFDNNNTLLLRVGNLHLPVDHYSLWCLLYAEESNGRDLNTECVVERSIDGQSSIDVLERHLSACRWVDRNAVVHVERTSGLSVSTNGHEDLKVSLAQSRRRHRTRSPQREDRSSTDVNGDLRKVDVIERDVLTLTLDFVVGLEIVEVLLREVRSDRGHVLLGNGRNENGITEEELEIDAICSGVLGEYVPEGMENGCTVKVGLVERSEEVIQESVPGRGKGGRSITRMKDLYEQRT